MVKRFFKDIIINRLKSSPAVAFVGPRQIGKTTLARTISKRYYDLEIEEDKLKTDIQWESIKQAKEPVILDEAQNYPEIFPRLKSAIDEEREKNGRFIILGSVSPSLMHNVSEFLTGRISLCELPGFSILETPGRPLDNLWFTGAYPGGGILGQEKYPLWHSDYLNLLAMRDLPHWGLPAKPRVTLQFFKMLAGLHGSVWNASQIGKSMGLSYHTVNTYLDYLENVFLIRRIRPYYKNIKKRLIKSPKIYWRDSGLLHSLLNASSFSNLLAQPWVGTSWEGFIIEQILIYLNNNDIRYSGPYYLRTKELYEIDMLLEFNSKLWAVEIKLTTDVRKSEIDKFLKTCELIMPDRKIIISRTRNIIEGPQFLSCDLTGFLDYLKKHETAGPH